MHLRLKRLIMQVDPCAGMTTRNKGDTKAPEGFDPKKAGSNTDGAAPVFKNAPLGTKPSADPSGLWGRGYEHSNVREALPKLPQGMQFDDGMRDKYKEFQDKRRKGDRKAAYEDQWVNLQDSNIFEKMDDDPFTEKQARAAVQMDKDVLIVGGGLGGLIQMARLNQAGFTDTVTVEKGGDVGGTWYWNRYPGIACDVESYAYMPLLEDCDYIPSMKYASGFEIQEHARRIAEKYGVYKEGRSLFHTTVEECNWDEGSKRWRVGTNRGDMVRARFVILANGMMTQPKLANLPGMEKYKGVSFHTSRWDYSHDLRGKKVGIIGTGATSCQCVPELAKVVGELYVFMRTPSPIDIRNNIRTSEKMYERFKSTPGWDKIRRENFDAFMGEGKPKGGTRAPRKSLTQEQRDEIWRKQENNNFKGIQAIRMRIPSKVVDKKAEGSGRSLQEALTPWYPAGGKRPVFHDEYLPTFNLPNVFLVDTDGQGVERISENGPVCMGKEYPVDVLVYATGFRFFMTGTYNKIKGRTPMTMAEKWSTGTKTFFGQQIAGFPNLFILVGPQAAGARFNFLSMCEDQCDYVTKILKHMRDVAKAEVVDIDERAEKIWVDHCIESDMQPSVARSLKTKEGHQPIVGYYTQEGTKRPGDADYSGGGKCILYTDDADTWLEGTAKGRDTNLPHGEMFPMNPYLFQ